MWKFVKWTGLSFTNTIRSLLLKYINCHHLHQSKVLFIFFKLKSRFSEKATKIRKKSSFSIDINYYLQILWPSWEIWTLKERKCKIIPTVEQENINKEKKRKGQLAKNSLKQLSLNYSSRPSVCSGAWSFEWVELNEGPLACHFSRLANF